MLTIDKLGERELDILKELGNIGAGNAATALSQILAKKVDMNVPQVKVYDVTDVPELLGGPENIVCGVLLKMFGDLQGNIMFLLPEESAQRLLGMMLGQDIMDVTSEMSRSAIMEVGNIIASSYLNSLSFFSEMTVIPSTPAFAYDMAGALLSAVLFEVGELSDQVVLIESDFSGNGEVIKGHFFVLPNLESLNALLKAVGAKVDGE